MFQEFQCFRSFTSIAGRYEEAISVCVFEMLQYLASLCSVLKGSGSLGPVCCNAEIRASPFVVRSGALVAR